VVQVEGNTRGTRIVRQPQPGVEPAASPGPGDTQAPRAVEPQRPTAQAATALQTTTFVGRPVATAATVAPVAPAVAPPETRSVARRAGHIAGLLATAGGSLTAALGGWALLSAGGGSLETTWAVMLSGVSLLVVGAPVALVGAVTAWFTRARR
jgi:hypothetical protein